MGNNASKRKLAEEFNQKRIKRAEAEKALAQDKIDNPDKYKSNKEALHHIRMFMAMSAGIGIT